jgi:hypothetical protein
MLLIISETGSKSYNALQYNLNPNPRPVHQYSPNPHTLSPNHHHNKSVRSNVLGKVLGFLSVSTQAENSRVPVSGVN